MKLNNDNIRNNTKISTHTSCDSNEYSRKDYHYYVNKKKENEVKKAIPWWLDIAQNKNRVYGNVAHKVRKRKEELLLIDIKRMESLCLIMCLVIVCLPKKTYFSESLICCLQGSNDTFLLSSTFAGVCV